MQKHILKNALINAGATATYILLVVWFMSNIENLFDGPEPSDSILVPVIMLLTFVVSAAITGFAVFGRSIMWYLDGQKKDAVKLLGATIVFLVLIALILLSIVL